VQVDTCVLCLISLAFQLSCFYFSNTRRAGCTGGASQRTLLKPHHLLHGPAGRRRLAAFDTAGTGGKKGVSCEYSAHMKAKQACAERQFLQRCEKESKTPKQKLKPWEQVCYRTFVPEAQH
jgi:hypothetical protein